jgi:hypothetical protein
MLRIGRTRAWHDFDRKEQAGTGLAGLWTVCARVIFIGLQQFTLRETLHAVCLSYPFQSFTMTAALVTEEQTPQMVPIDDDNDVDVSDEEGAPEIAATDGQFCVILSVLCHP